jgi:hypothetical protein
MLTALWEWSVTRDADGGPVGVSMTRHGAMEALAKALVEAGRPNRGQVMPMLLATPVQSSAYYLRFWPQHTAIYDGQVLRWQ